MKKIPIFFTMGCICCGAIYAKSTTKLDTITVNAQRNEQSKAEISRSISVVDNETIEHRQSINVPNLLNEEAGISYAPDSMQAGQVVIRGFSTQNFRAPLFINGDRFRGRNTLEYTLLDPDQIERIEIIRGPASSLYGTDSFGGMINVITKRATGDVNAPFHLTDTYIKGEYQTANKGMGTRVQLGGIGNGFDVLLGLNGKKGFDYRSADGKIPNSDYESKSFDLRAGYTFLQNHRVEIMAKYAQVDRGRAGGQFGAPGAGNADGVLQRQQRDVPMKEKYISLGYEGKFDTFNLETSLYRRELDTHVNVYPNLNNPETFVDVFVNGPVVYGGKTIGTQQMGNLHSTYGFDWYREKRDSAERSVKGGAKVATSPMSKQLDLGVFALQEYHFDNDIILSGSVRYDYVKTSIDTDYITDPTTKTLFEDAGDTKNSKTTGGVGVIIPITSNVDIVGNVNTSFRVASTTEISAVGSGVGADFRIPNTSIKPEEGITYEIGARYNDNRFSSSLVYFTSDYDNLIVTKTVEYQGEVAKQIQNVGESKIWGIEFEFEADIMDNLIFKTNVSYLRGEDKITHEPLAQIMPLNGFVSLKYLPSFLSGTYLEYTNQWASKRTRVDESSERERSGYLVSNIYMETEFKNVKGFEGIEVNFGIENVFDKKYSLSTVPENIKYPISKTNPLLQPGINFKLSVTAKF